MANPVRNGVHTATLFATPDTVKANQRSRASRLRRPVAIALLPLAALTAACGADQLASASGAATDAAPASADHDH